MTPKTAVIRDGQFHYVACLPVPALLPDRFSEPLDSLSDESWSPDEPPLGWIEEQARRGDVVMLQRLRDAFADARPEDATTYALMLARALSEAIVPWIIELIGPNGALPDHLRSQIMTNLRYAALAYPALAAAMRAAGSDIEARLEAVELDDELDEQYDHRSPEPESTPLFRGSTFDTETDFYPNRHDRLLYKLARLVAPTLDDVIFEEVPAPDDGEVIATPQLADRYVLFAHVGASHYEVVAGDPSDWLDVPAMIGLLNVLLRDRDDARRFVAIATGDQTANVIVGPARELVNAAVAGTIAICDPAEPARLGLEFERSVLSRTR